MFFFEKQLRISSNYHSLLFMLCSDEKDKKGVTNQLVTPFFWFHVVMLYKQASYLEDQCWYYPCQERGVAGGKACPFPTARFALDGGYRGNAREVEQYEEEEAIGG